MDRSELYDQIARRKSKPADLDPYVFGQNGRIDNCIRIFRANKIVPMGELLDVGGAIGDLGYHMRNDFKRRIVVDIAAQNRRACELKGNEFYTCDVDKQPLPVEDQSVTVVTALDFIEHIVDPENFARECFRVLKPGGDVFINTPNIRFWPHIQQLLVDGTFPHTSGDKEVFHGGHLAFYTYKDLCNIFGRAGFGKFEMVMDSEGYRQPNFQALAGFVAPRNQEQYKQLSMELGCPNLLFICRKP